MKMFIRKNDVGKATKTRFEKRKRVVFTSLCLILTSVLTLSVVELIKPVGAASVTSVSHNIGWVAGGTEVTITGDFSQPVPTAMQDMTKKYCTSMTVYDGTNPSAILNLKDKRGGRQYQVAKLADGNCWMLNNLKLADYTATAADTDLNDISSFTIPALDTTKNSNADTPYVYGPMPGDTGAGATNYGYLYNWPAVTAGESMTTMPGDDTKNNLAPNSICPKGWRLPIGGEVFEVSNEFDQLNAAMAGYSGNQDPLYQANFYSVSVGNWQNTGPFKGVLAGEWNGHFKRFDAHGKSGMFWSAKASVLSPHQAHAMIFNAFYAPMTHAEHLRSNGNAVRCVVADNATSKPTPVVNIGGNLATVTAHDDKSITFITPAHAPGVVDIAIDLGGKVTPLALGGAFTYVDVPNVPATSVGRH
jgi:uncharacterized protein (TIGR02145 family)